MSVYVGNTKYKLMTSSGRATLTPDYIQWKNMSVTAPTPFYVENTRQLDNVKFLGMCEQNLRVRNQLVYDGYEVQFDLNNTSGTGLIYSVVSSGKLSFKGAVVKGHKYYKECVADFDENYDTFENFYWSTLQVAEWYITANSSSVFTSTTTRGSNAGSLLVRGLPVGKRIAGTMTFQIIDLTLLYGAGNEPETVQEFKDSYEEMFGQPLTYESYNPGTVLETKDIICNNGALKWDSVNNEIYVDGTQEILKVCGKNLACFVGIYNITDEDLTPQSGGYKRTFSCHVTSGIQYTVSVEDGTSSYSYFVCYDNTEYDNPVLLAKRAAQTHNLTFTIPTGKTYLMVYISGNDETKVQIELGFSTSYEPYHDGGTALATNLLSCGSYKDMQDILTGDISRNVGIKILNGTERFALDNWRPYDGTYAFALYKNELPGILEASTDNVKSTHFQSATYSGGGGVYYGGTGINIYSNNGDYSIFIRVPNSIATSMATMKAWLAQQYANGTPVIVVYPLNSTETDSPVTGQELSIQKGTNTFEIIQSSVDNLSLHVDYKAVENIHDYLSFTATESSSITLKKVGSPTAVNLEYSPNKTAWIPYTIGETIPIANGNTLYFRNSDSTVKTQLSNSNTKYYQFVMTGSIEGGGNIMSLLDKSCTSTTVGNNCFYKLFRGCTVLKEPPKLPATTIGSSAYYDMFYGCTYLRHSPELPALTLGSYCYYDMFVNCTRMIEAPVLPATTLVNGCYYCMFQNCQTITSHHVANLNNSCQKMFNNNYACTQLTIDAVTPPTINSDTFSGMKSDCIIYVPAESVDVYKDKQYWSARASYIQAIPSD